MASWVPGWRATSPTRRARRGSTAQSGAADRRRPQVTAGRDLVLTIAHDAGSDLSAGGYDGFRVVGAGGAVALASARPPGAGHDRARSRGGPGAPLHRLPTSTARPPGTWPTWCANDAPDLSLPLRPFDLELVWGTDADDLVVVDTDALFKAIGGAGDDTLELRRQRPRLRLHRHRCGRPLRISSGWNLGGGGKRRGDRRGANLLGLAGTGATGLTIDGTGADTADSRRGAPWAASRSPARSAATTPYAASGIDFHPAGRRGHRDRRRVDRVGRGGRVDGGPAPSAGATSPGGMGGARQFSACRQKRSN